MTAQFSDSVFYKRKEYVIAGVNGVGLFDPTQHGMAPVGKCSACWRGFLCEYGVHGQELRLDTLSIYLNNPAPTLFGVTPRAGGAILRFDAEYKNLRQKVPYTGGLLIAKDFVRDLYVHMGFHPAWKYRTVHELIFEVGNLVKEADRSPEIARFREDVANRPLEPTGPFNEKEVRAWIEKCFSLKYKW
jgi:hypothetical protein